MQHGIALTDKEIQNVISTYNCTNSIYQAAKKNKIHYTTAKKYIYINIPELSKTHINNGIKDKRTTKSYLPQLKADAPYIYNNIKENKEIKDKKDININTDRILSSNNYYIKSLDTILSRIIKRYKRELADIPIDKLYLHFGTLFDKRNNLIARDSNKPDSQVILNFYGRSDDKLKGFINKIKESKGALNDR